MMKREGSYSREFPEGKPDAVSRSGSISTDKAHALDDLWGMMKSYQAAVLSMNAPVRLIVETNPADFGYKWRIMSAEDRETEADMPRQQLWQNAPPTLPGPFGRPHVRGALLLSSEVMAAGEVNEYAIERLREAGIEVLSIVGSRAPATYLSFEHAPSNEAYATLSTFFDGADQGYVGYLGEAQGKGAGATEVAMQSAQARPRPPIVAPQMKDSLPGARVGDWPGAGVQTDQE